MGHDVVVIGAGLAGLTAARELTRGGFDVVVLEGRDRVGGRMFSDTLAGVTVDRGASFVGPTQEAVLRLAAELDCPIEPTFRDGANLIRWRGKVRSFSGTIPKLGPVGLLDIGRIRWQFERVAEHISIREPWSGTKAAKLDAISLGSWLRSIHATASSRELMSIMSRVVWGSEPDELSMLHVARYVKAAGGLDRMLDVANGAQQDHFPRGSHEMAVKMAAELGDRIRLRAVVSRIEWSAARGPAVAGEEEQADGAAAVTSTAGTVEARRVIVTVPPAQRLGIDIAPAPPIEYQQLAQRWPQGALTKSYAAYRTPFWRAKGLSGQAMSDEGPVFLTFDVSPGPDGPGVLLGFTDPKRFDALPAEHRRKTVLDSFASIFGEEANDAIDYLDQRWGAETFAPGGPTAAVPPGSWTEFGPLLRRPVGPLHWAGTETADDWTGFMDGAVRSGLRVSNEVLRTLRGRGPTATS